MATGMCILPDIMFNLKVGHSLFITNFDRSDRFQANKLILKLRHSSEIKYANIFGKFVLESAAKKCYFFGGGEQLVVHYVNCNAMYAVQSNDIGYLILNLSPNGKDVQGYVLVFQVPRVMMRNIIFPTMYHKANIELSLQILNYTTVFHLKFCTGVIMKPSFFKVCIFCS